MLNEKDISLKGVNLYKDFPYISAKTNSGKTTFAVLSLRQMIEKKIGRKMKRTILLTPYRNTKEQILKDDRFVFVADEISNVNCAFFGHSNEKVFVCTYSAFAHLLAKGFDVAESLLIWDEIHTFMDFATYQEQMGYLVDFLLNKDLFESTVCVGMTGTPQVIDYIGDSMPFNFIDITPKSRMNLKVEKGTIIEFGSIESTVKKLILDNAAKGSFVYVSSATAAIKITRLFQSKGLNAAFLVSTGNDNYDAETGLNYNQLMDTQIYDRKSIRDWVIQDSDLPHELDVLVINDANRDGINILDRDNRFNQVIVESTNAAVIEQVRSRIRHDIDNIYVVFTSKYKSRMEFLADEVSAFDWYLSVETESDYQQKLEARYNEQRESVFDAVLSNQRYNDAKRAGNSTKGRMQKLSLLVFKIRDRCILNPFAGIVARFELSNFNEGAYGLSTSLKPMLEGKKSFSVIAGRDWIEELRNQEALESINLIELFHLDRKDEWEITSEELRNKLNALGLKNSNRKKLSLAKSIEWLSNHGIHVSKPKRKMVCGKRSYFYTIRRN